MQLFNADCWEIFNSLPDKSVDCIITDPPYEFKPGGFGGGVNELSLRQFSNQINTDLLHQKFNVSILQEFCRLCKKVNIITFATDMMLPQILNFCIENNYYYTVLVWVKTNPIPFCANGYLHDIEYIVHIREAGVQIYGDYHTKSKAYISSVNKKDKALYNHPTIKPIELMKKLITNHTLEGEIVLDPFMGTGTTGVACQELHRDFISIEINEPYYQTAVTRLNINGSAVKTDVQSVSVSNINTETSLW